MLCKIVLAVALVAVCRAQVPHFGGCPKVTVVDNLDVSRYLGDWYEFKKFPFIIEAGESCIVANYSLLDNGHIKVFNRGQKSDGSIDEAIGDAEVPDPKVPAKLAVTFNGAPRVPYWIVDTDYDNYSLVWSCTDILGLGQLDFAWMLSRNRTLDKATEDMLTKKLENFGVDVSSFMPTGQENCAF